MISDEQILERWADALAAAWSLARAERTKMIRDRSGKRFDEAGLHTYSVEWGRVLALEELLPPMGNLRFIGGEACSPKTMRRSAAAEAEAEFATDVLARGAEAWAE